MALGSLPRPPRAVRAVGVRAWLPLAARVSDAALAPPRPHTHHKHTHRRVSLSLAPGSAGRRPCHLRQATPGDERWAGAKAPLARLAAPRRAEHRGRRVPGAACVPCLPRCLLKKARPKRMRLPPCRRRRRCPNQTHALVPGGHRVGRRLHLRTGRGSLIGTTCCPVDSACPQGGIHAQTTCTAASSAIPTPGAPRWALPTRQAPLDLRSSACCPTPLYTHIRAAAWHVSHAPAHLRPIPAECTQRAPSGPSRAQVACPPLSPRACPRFQGQDAVDRNGARLAHPSCASVTIPCLPRACRTPLASNLVRAFQPFQRGDPVVSCARSVRFTVVSVPWAPRSVRVCPRYALLLRDAHVFAALLVATHSAYMPARGVEDV